MRSAHADTALLAAVRHAVEEQDPDVSVFDAKTLQPHLDVPLTPLRWTTAVLTAMGVVVLFLAALGLYGILSYAAAPSPVKNYHRSFYGRTRRFARINTCDPASREPAVWQRGCYGTAICSLCPGYRMSGFSDGSPSAGA